jgi:DNA-binding transcriptional MerR regulator
MTDAEKLAMLEKLSANIDAAYLIHSLRWKAMLDWLRQKGLSQDDVQTAIDMIEHMSEADDQLDKLLDTKAKLQRRRARQLDAAKHPVMGPPAPSTTAAKKDPKATHVSPK